MHPLNNWSRSFVGVALLSIFLQFRSEKFVAEPRVMVAVLASFFCIQSLLPFTASLGSLSQLIFLFCHCHRSRTLSARYTNPQGLPSAGMTSPPLRPTSGVRRRQRLSLGLCVLPDGHWLYLRGSCPLLSKALPPYRSISG